jgi:hypothetical protein
MCMSNWVVGIGLALQLHGACGEHASCVWQWSFTTVHSQPGNVVFSRCTSGVHAPCLVVILENISYLDCLL